MRTIALDTLLTGFALSLGIFVSESTVLSNPVLPSKSATANNDISNENFSRAGEGTSVEMTAWQETSTGSVVSPFPTRRRTR